MGLTHESTGLRAAGTELIIHKRSREDKVIALAGNPNVGKSTIFNALTGMNQHTGNWPGKTVACSQGFCSTKEHSYIMVDIPGTYSLMAHSAEEEVARDFLCFGQPDAVIVVCDATCLERNLNLVLQTLEITSQVIVCINLMDEARRKKIHIDIPALSRRLGVPVVGTSARKKDTLLKLLDTLDDMISGKTLYSPVKTRYPKQIEQAVQMLEPILAEKQRQFFGVDLSTDEQRSEENRYPADRHLGSPIGSQSHDRDISYINERWLSLKLLEQDADLTNHLIAKSGWNFLEDPELRQGISVAERYLQQESITSEHWSDSITSALISQSEKTCKGIISYEKKAYHSLDLTLDKLLTSRFTGIPIMLLMLCGIFWFTIVGANYPSDLLANALFWVQNRLTDLFMYLHAPSWLHGILVLGLYRVLAWVVSVMLPPMAIFFPLFTLLEDAGYLPRIAYNLDKPFQCSGACGKQCLSMAMGLGCNAAGVTGCRIIDSPRERLLAILTNSLVPCNGRFPALISIITMFFAGSFAGWYSPMIAAILLTGLILLGILMTFLTTRILSSTLLKGIPSAFTLELPPYRRPQIGKVILRSIFDRTLFVLGRAICVAAPAGVLLWLLANVTIHGDTLLQIASGFLDPFARWMGLDGVILISFILGFPANEIVLPIMVMAYLSQSTLSSSISLTQMHQVFLANGWTITTAMCTLLFILMHWPCSTTLLTVKKETGSMKWTAIAALLPTLCGILFCVFLNLLMNFVRIS